MCSDLPQETAENALQVNDREKSDCKHIVVQVQAHTFYVINFIV